MLLCTHQGRVAAQRDASTIDVGLIMAMTADGGIVEGRAG